MKKAELSRQLAAKNCAPKLLCTFNEDVFPFIIMSETQKLDIMCLRVQLRCMSEENAFVIGRSKEADYKTLCYPNLSRIHCFILKDGTHYALYDVSKYGTRILSKTKSPRNNTSLKEKIMNIFH